jgi:hypothetical protein
MGTCKKAIKTWTSRITIIFWFINLELNKAKNKVLKMTNSWKNSKNWLTIVNKKCKKVLGELV